MNTDEFLTRVRDRAGLVDYQDARRACEVVFQTLRSLLTHPVGDRVANELSDELKKLWEAGLMDHLSRSMKGVEEMNMLQFLDRVRDEGRLQTRDQAVVVTQAVLATLNEHLSHSVKRDIVRELPNDIHEFWQSSFKVEEEGTAYASAHGMVYEPGGTTITGAATPRIETGEDMPPETIETEAMRTGAYRETQPTQQESRALPEEVEARESSMTEPGADLPEGQYGSDKIGPAAAEIYRSDQQIRSEIEDLLDASDEVDASAISVGVQQGRVILKGNVKDPSQRAAAERIASEALGSTGIDNELRTSE